MEPILLDYICERIKKILKPNNKQQIVKDLESGIVGYNSKTLNVDGWFSDNASKNIFISKIQTLINDIK